MSATIHVLPGLERRDLGEVRPDYDVLSGAMAEGDTAIKGFLYPRMYRHTRVMRIMSDAETVVRDLFAHYLTDPEAMPEDWRQGLQAKDEASRALRAGDFIAGMTDRYALEEHARYFDSTPELR